MSGKEEKEICYVSNSGSNTIGIIDARDYHKIKEIEVPLRPQNIVIDENNNVYVASDRGNTITVIDDRYHLKKTWNIPNNGNIQVDSNTQKLYVSNTEEVLVFSLITGKKLGVIAGFKAANNIKLDKNKERLFVLDVLSNEIKVYQSVDLKFIKIYENIGIAPSDFIITDDGDYLYIGNKGSKKEIYSGNISIINMKEDSISSIELKEESSITGLENSGDYLYCINNGLNKIDIINIEKKQSIISIETTYPIIQKIKLSPNKKELFSISSSIDGKSALDKMDVRSHVILETYVFEEKNSMPYDIGVVLKKEVETQREEVTELKKKSSQVEDTQNKLKQKKGITILAPKIVSMHEEKISFSKVRIDIPKNVHERIDVTKIRFKKCEIIIETFSRKVIEDRQDYSIVEYGFYIPYYICSKDTRQQEYTIKGRIHGSHKATLHIPEYEEQKGINFVANSFTKLTNSKIYSNNVIKVDLDVLISTKVVVDEVVHISQATIMF